MKLSIIGAGGVRTPLIVQAILKRQDRLGLTELSLMDIDEEHLEIIGGLTTQLEQTIQTEIQIHRTTDPRQALKGANFVITTFRVGGIESRVIDEKVPLMHGIIGQETTGPGGFAMAMRSIPVILDYVNMMEELCPQAWLINFANPAGMLTEAVIRNSSWRRVVGICDTPNAMHQVISSLLGASPDEVYLDYLGLNHLGWIKRVLYHQQDKLPELIQGLKAAGGFPGLPFDPELIVSLGMIPNEYLYYFYYTTRAVDNILAAGESRGEQIATQNHKLFADMRQKFGEQDINGMQEIYQSYMYERGNTYMVKETGKVHDFSKFDPEVMKTLWDEGYAGVALNLIEALSGNKSRLQIINVPNEGSINGMEAQDVVEIPAMVSQDHIQPLAVGEIPVNCIGLIKQVKQYEKLTIQAAVEKSYLTARLALTTHPLVRDYSLAGVILDEYIAKHQGYFPSLR